MQVMSRTMSLLRDMKHLTFPHSRLGSEKAIGDFVRSGYAIIISWINVGMTTKLTPNYCSGMKMLE